MPDIPPSHSQPSPSPSSSPIGTEPGSRRRFLLAAAALPVIGATPFLVDRLRDGAPATSGDALEVRLTSEDGRFQALAAPLPDGASIYAPGGRTQSTIAVRDQRTGLTRTMTLDRNLEPEAFSPDGRMLYAIDHRPAEAPATYRVSGIDLESQEVGETLGPLKVALVDDMSGSGRQQVWSPRGDQLYTLYIRQYHEHVHPAEDSSHGHDGEPTAAFVHVLDVSADWALCVDLPAGFGLGPADTTAIMVDETGTTITVVDHALGSLVEVTRLPDTEKETGRFDVSELRPLAD